MKTYSLSHPLSNSHFSSSTLTVSNTSLPSLLISLLQVLGGSLLIALCAQIAIPLFFTPVPLTLQTFAVMLVGGSLGSKKGFLAVLAYLVEASLGFPVLAGGISNPLALIGLHGGYLMGFLVQAYVLGLWFEKHPKIQWQTALPFAMFASLIQLGLGALWLGQFIGWKSILILGVTPFIVGEFIKNLAFIQYMRYNTKA